jgi:hypothetical protein
MASRLIHAIRSNLVLFMALAVALTVGTAYAATTAPKNSVTSKSIKNGQVKTRDMAKQAVTGKKVKANSLTGKQINEASLDSNVLQRRIADACPSGQALTAVGSDGSVTCTTTGGPPSGTAGGDLSGIYPNPQIAPGAVGTNKLADLAVITAKLAEHAVTGDKVAHDTLTGTNIDESTFSTSPSGAASGALTGSYPNPSLNVSGGPCANGKAMTNLSGGGAITCGPGVYSDASDNVAAGPPSYPGIFGAEGLTAVGARALQANFSSDYNSAFGSDALAANSLGNYNSAFGSGALMNNTIGDSNTAVGLTALQSNSNGSFNTAVGVNALYNSTGSDNVAVGDVAGSRLTTGSNNIDIANMGCFSPCTESNTTRIGTAANQYRAFIAGITGVTTGGVASPVLVDADGQLGTTSSSRRFKRDIEPLDQASRKLMDLNPVSFRYKHSYTGAKSSRQFGLLAEQVARVYPNLVVYGEDSEPSAIAYQEFPALLLAQAQRQESQIEDQQARNERLQGQVERQRARNDRQHRQIRWLMQHIRSR